MNGGAEAGLRGERIMYNSWLECVRGCGRSYSIYDVVYRCEDCGGLLDVAHDLQALRARSASTLQA